MHSTYEEEREGNQSEGGVLFCFFFPPKIGKMCSALGRESNTQKRPKRLNGPGKVNAGARRQWEGTGLGTGNPAPSLATHRRKEHVRTQIFQVDDDDRNLSGSSTKVWQGAKFYLNPEASRSALAVYPVG